MFLCKAQWHELGSFRMVFGFLINRKSHMARPKTSKSSGSHQAFFHSWLTNLCLLLHVQLWLLRTIVSTMEQNQSRRFRCCNVLSPKSNKSNLLWLVHAPWKTQVIPAVSFKLHVWKACVKLCPDSAMSRQVQTGVTAQAMYVWTPRLDHVWHGSNCTARCHIWAISRKE